MKFDFPNSNGEILSGKLELPIGRPKAYALFAHCFTCSKDIIAPNVISRKLTDNGIAVLRFDFTGLGNSQGDFSNTNFSSNVEDLISASEELGRQFKAPEILIGHSLGGAAVLKAATKLNDIKAVVTLAAPSSVDHVSHLFANDIEKIEKEGVAEVQLAGRTFTIKKQFINDINETEILKEVRNFKKALLVMHSPFDDTVGIEHASKIYDAAKHPKSFITLDSADHLLMNRNDASYAADIIGAWVQRYILQSFEKPKLGKGEVIVQSRPQGKFTHDVFTKDHAFIADEPKSVKGNHLGMNPYEILLASLGACTAMTLRMYADRKGIDLKDTKVRLKHEKIHAKDCEDCETKTGLVDKIDKEIFIEGDFDEGQKQRLLEIAERCPVNKTLQSEIKIMSHHL